MSRKIYYMGLAVAASMRSTCQQAQVGCVLVKNDRVVATGYNGTLPGKLNCDGGLNCQSSHKGTPLCLTIHAEINAIHQAGYQLRDASAYVTRHPCLGCAQALILAGVNQIYYLQNNTWAESVASLLATQAPHVTLEQVNPNEVKKLLWSAATSLSPICPQLFPDNQLAQETKPNGTSVNQWLLSETYARPEPIFPVNNPGLPNDGQRVLIDKEQPTGATGSQEDNRKTAPSWNTKPNTNFKPRRGRNA